MRTGLTKRGASLCVIQCCVEEKWNMDSVQFGVDIDASPSPGRRSPAVTLRSPPEIMTQPVQVLVVEPGKSLRLQVQALSHGDDLCYQWCRRVRDDPTISDETAEQHIFREHSVEFEQLVDVPLLFPSLYNTHMLTSSQAEDLTLQVPGNTQAMKVQRLLLWLPKSSLKFLDHLIACLQRTSKESQGHRELAKILERELWVPLSTQHCRYDGATNSTLILCCVRREHEGVYRCRVTNSAGMSVLSEPSQVILVKPDDEAVNAFIEDLKASPESAADLAQTLISRLQDGSSVGYVAMARAIREVGECKEVVRAFLAHGWSPNEKMEGGRTLVHELAENGHTETLAMILHSSGGECTRIADEARNTPLHLAVTAGMVETVGKLLEVEAARTTINYQDKDFCTALHLAVELGSGEMVNTLLTIPTVNLGILNKENLTALELARQKGHDHIVTKLTDPNVQRTWSEGTSGYASSISGLSTMRWNKSLTRTESLQLLDTPNRKIIELQRQLVNYSGTLTGKQLLKHGVLGKCNRKGSKKDVTIFALTDVILYTSHNEFKQKYTVKAELSVRGMKVLDLEDSEQPAVRDEPLSFTITSKERALHLVASSQEEKEDWIQCLENAKAALREAPGHHSSLPHLEGAGMGARAPVWVLDTHVTACQLANCNKKFTFLDRKHHCRQCGKVVCGKCSAQKRYLLYKKREERVCDECIEAYAGCDRTSAGSEAGAEESETVTAGYVTRHHRGKAEKKWYRLESDGVLYVFGAHKDTTPTHRITLMSYTVQGDLGSQKICLTHHQGRDELYESFTVPPDAYNRWYKELKSMTMPSMSQ